MSEPEELEAMGEHYARSIEDAFAAYRVLAIVEQSVDAKAVFDIIKQRLVADKPMPVTVLNVILKVKGFPNDSVPVYVSIYPNGDYELDLTNARLVDFETMTQFEIAIKQGSRKAQASWNEIHRPAPAASQEQATTTRSPDAGGSILPPIEDPIDQQIYAIVSKNPDLSDDQVAGKLSVKNPKTGEPLGRQAVNERRKALQKMGYKVR